MFEIGAALYGKTLLLPKQGLPLMEWIRFRWEQILSFKSSYYFRQIYGRIFQDLIFLGVYRNKPILAKRLKMCN